MVLVASLVGEPFHSHWGSLWGFYYAREVSHSPSHFGDSTILGSTIEPSLARTFKFAILHQLLVTLPIKRFVGGLHLNWGDKNDYSTVGGNWFALSLLYDDVTSYPQHTVAFLATSININQLNIKLKTIKIIL